MKKGINILSGTQFPKHHLCRQLESTIKTSDAKRRFHVLCHPKRNFLWYTQLQNNWSQTNIKYSAHTKKTKKKVALFLFFLPLGPFQNRCCNQCGLSHQFGCRAKCYPNVYLLSLLFIFSNSLFPLPYSPLLSSSVLFSFLPLSLPLTIIPLTIKGKNFF
jgi:hypothetical protein